MGKQMVIVESPAKARTIERYLGRDFYVRASAGHIMDLPTRALGVNIKKDFSPTYRVISGKEKVVADLKKAAEKASAIYLAADPDREGEAICYHLALQLDGKSDRKVHRILFNEITKTAILKAFDNPSEIDVHKVEAQQARRILDRLVGYKVSPLLWRKVRKGLSAGRVQTVAVRLIVDREREIRAFKPEEYWEFGALAKGSKPPPFELKASKYKGKKFKIGSQQEADALLAELQGADFVVRDIKKRKRKRNPVPPYITSKLQQESVRRLGFTVKKTMTIAQRLYEGVELGDEGAVGLITYMRTDSTRVSEGALQEARSYIGEVFGNDFLPNKANIYRGKKSAQDAHEAIRPTSVSRDPESMKRYLKRDELRLYQLIWQRFVASQMTPARFDQTEILVDAGQTEFKAVGSIMRFEGFLKLYQETEESSKRKARKEEDRVLPDLEQGEKLTIEKILREQKFTQPPPRYNEASLVKALEDKGIGRPSTYQQILSVIMTRDYVKKDQGRFSSTQLGEIVNDLLVAHFDEIFDYNYTAKLETDLDRIEEGKTNWVDALTEFYYPFKEKLQTAKVDMKNLKKEGIPTDEVCEKCNSAMVIRFGKFGRFMACANFPDCRNTREAPEEDDGKPEAGSTGEWKEPCDKCGRPMVVKKGQYGDFLACSGYPECKNTQKIVRQKGEIKLHSQSTLDEKCPKCGTNLVLRNGRFGEFTSCGNYPECRYIKPDLTGVKCPRCKEGELVGRKSRRGRAFFACDRYPDCNFTVWNRPIPNECPDCGSAYVLEKTTKKDGTFRFCPEKACGYKKPIESGESEDSPAPDPGPESVAVASENRG